MKEKFNNNLREELFDLKVLNSKLIDLLEDYLNFFDHAINDPRKFEECLSNGNTDPCGSHDEGIVTSLNFLVNLEEESRAIIDKYKRDNDGSYRV